MKDFKTEHLQGLQQNENEQIYIGLVVPQDANVHIIFVAFLLRFKVS